MAENFEYKDQKIQEVQMEKEIKKSFINYAMSVIVSRALPDVRDGLKPVHRRILYAMYEDHLTHDRPYCKSATTVGNVLGRYHPHGDASVYDAMVRLAQTFNMRYTLIDGQGNFGNIDGDQAAAYRYTEARLTRLASEMMTDIDKDVVDFGPNFDNKLKEPLVLPSRFPNLLVNGSMGIAVGMATNIPTHNLSEVVDGTIFLMENPDATIPEIMNYIKAPDFPTAAMICGTRGIYDAYTTGRGKIMVRARAHIEEENRRIVITEIPYQVNKQLLVETMANCVKDKKIEGITDIRDETGRAGMRIVVEYRRDANGQIILNQLYKFTQLQDTCAVNMLAIVDGVPRVLNLKEVLNHYISFQEEVITRKIRFELQKALAEMHIYEGYKIAIDNIDEVIAIIRASESVSAARNNLMARFGFTEIQAQAIVDMTLGKLSGLERIKIEERLAKLRELVEELRAILADETMGKIKEIIKTDLLAIKAKYGDERRTELVPLEEEIELEDLIERHVAVITMTHDGYIKRIRSDEYTAQRRGGKGVTGIKTKETDFVEQVLATDSHSHLMLFTNKGKVHVMKAYRIPEAGKTAKGSNIVNMLLLEDGEKITTMISVPEFAENEYLLFVTKQGVVKRTPLSEYEYQRKGGKIALSLDEGDELVFVRRSQGDSDVLIATHEGNATRFIESDARPMGRTARGVRGIRLDEGDFVKGVALVEENKMLITITEKGFGKRSSFDEFARRNRGGKGVICHNLNDKTGMLAGILTVDDKDDIMLITNDGTVIRTAVSEIPSYSRTASGVIVMRPDEDSIVANITRVSREEEEEDEKRRAEEALKKEALESGNREALAAFDEPSEEESETESEEE
ncbi:MAG: DNA gyrase subunit A [Clostridia bacterium]|nr:DNA gyrase subunit A [Clostridia bacterium]